MAEDKKKKGSYSAQDIQVLEGLEPVRKKRAQGFRALFDD
jgi:hypothetical protein